MTHPYLTLESPIRLAHRGSRVLWPENTLPAFQGAVDLGYRYVETDVRITQDHVVVVFHDATLERTTNGAGRVNEWQFDDVRRLDAAYRFDEPHGFPQRGSDVTVSSLEEVLLTWPEVHFNIDIKGRRMAWHVAEVVKRLNREESTLIGSFSDRRVGRYRRIMGDPVATSAGPAVVAAMFAASRIGRTVHRPVQAYQLPYDYRMLPLDRRLIDAVHASGAHVHAWTVNKPHDMMRLLDMGVDGIVTDRPDVLNEVLANRTA